MPILLLIGRRCLLIVYVLLSSWCRPLLLTLLGWILLLTKCLNLLLRHAIPVLRLAVSRGLRVLSRGLRIYTGSLWPLSRNMHHRSRSRSTVRLLSTRGTLSVVFSLRYSVLDSLVSHALPDVLPFLFTGFNSPDQAPTLRRLFPGLGSHVDKGRSCNSGDVLLLSCREISRVVSLNVGGIRCSLTTRTLLKLSCVRSLSCVLLPRHLSRDIS